MDEVNTEGLPSPPLGAGAGMDAAPPPAPIVTGLHQYLHL